MKVRLSITWRHMNRGIFFASATTLTRTRASSATGSVSLDCYPARFQARGLFILGASFREQRHGQGICERHRYAQELCASARRESPAGNGYNGTLPYLKPGALLAVRPQDQAAVAALLSTQPAKLLLDALVDYGGYIVDDTGSQQVRSG